jgi:hypothetical protein
MVDMEYEGKGEGGQEDGKQTRMVWGSYKASGLQPNTLRKDVARDAHSQ